MIRPAISCSRSYSATAAPSSAPDRAGEPPLVTRPERRPPRRPAPPGRAQLGAVAAGIEIGQIPFRQRAERLRLRPRLAHFIQKHRCPNPWPIRYHAREDMGRGPRSAKREHQAGAPTAAEPGGSRESMDYATCRSLPAMFFDAAERRGDRPFLWAKRDGTYRPLSWARGGRARSTRWRAGCCRSASSRGDRVALVSENRPEWVIADLAIMSAGADHRARPIRPTRSTTTATSSATAARARSIVSTAALAASASLPAAEQVPSVRAVDRDRAGRRGKRVIGRDACLGRRCSPTRRGAAATTSRARVAALDARRHRLPHLHLGHRRRAEGRDADPPQHHRQLPRRLSAPGNARARRRGVPLASCRCRIPTSTRPG